jgi:predicted RNA-binding Zn-ribbon protein involved in translation (DUF1610 family)
LTGERSPKKKEEEVFEFDCPECGAHIVGEVSRCPKCGVEFIIEEVEEFHCPVCGALLPPDATVCPNCGARFDTATPGKALPPEQEMPAEEPEMEMAEEVSSDTNSMSEKFATLVAEVKPLMTLAREYDVEVSEGKSLIDKAVRAGKGDDIQSAVDFVRESRSSIQDAIKNRLQEDIVQLEKLSKVATRMGENPQPILDAINNTRAYLSASDHKAALSSAKEGMRKAELITGKYIEAMSMVETLSRMVENAGRFYIDVQDAKAILDEAMRAEEAGDWSMMGILARKGREQMLTSVPTKIQEELTKAKSTLLDAKAEGKDVSKLVRLLKEAGVALKRERYEDSLEKLVEFKSEMRHL